MTLHLTRRVEQMSIYDAAMRYAREGVPLVVLAGKEYGSGSSRDWAAKGTRLLGVRAVIAESFERIHRSNLVGMGVLPLQFTERRQRRVAGPDGRGDVLDRGLAAAMNDGDAPREVTCVRGATGRGAEFAVHGADRHAHARQSYFRHGGILQYVLRRLLPHERLSADPSAERCDHIRRSCSRCWPRAARRATRRRRRRCGARRRRRSRRRCSTDVVGHPARARVPGRRRRPRGGWW